MSAIGFGDLVAVKGYKGRIFFVEGFRHENHFYPGENWAEKVFDVTCVNTGDFLEVDAEDLTLLAKRENADAYLRENKPADVDVESYAEFGYMIGVKPIYVQTARELSGLEAERRKFAQKERAAKIDRLLAELYDYMALADNFGDQEYRARIEELRKKLSEIG